MALTPDDDDLLARVRLILTRHGQRVVLGLFGLMAVVILLLGFYQVQPGEVGVVQTFGAQSGTTKPGLHYAIPFVQTATQVNTAEVRRILVGFSKKGATGGADTHEDRMLTGDENIVEARIIVQYRVADPTKFLFRLKDPVGTLRDTAEVALRDVVGRMKVDQVITTRRDKVQLDTREQLQKLMDLYESGIQVTEVKLQEADVPEKVKEAFRDVIKAREEKQKLVNKAKAYQADKLPTARGRAEKLINEAKGYQKERELRARGDAARFSALREEYEKAPEVTRKRLYLEAMERILARTKRKVVVDSELASKTLPVLPLGGALAGSGVVGGSK